MNNIDLWLFTYRDSMNRKKHMAVFEPQKEEALRQFISNREPTDRLVEETPMTKEAYNHWKKQL